MPRRQVARSLRAALFAGWPFADAVRAAGLVAQEAAGQAGVTAGEDRDPPHVEAANGRVAPGGGREGAGVLVDVVRPAFGSGGVNAAALLRNDGRRLLHPLAQGASRHAGGVWRRHALGYLPEELVHLRLAVSAHDLPQDDPGEVVRGFRARRAERLGRGRSAPFG